MSISVLSVGALVTFASHADFDRLLVYPDPQAALKGSPVWHHLPFGSKGIVLGAAAVMDRVLVHVLFDTGTSAWVWRNYVYLVDV